MNNMSTYSFGDTSAMLHSENAASLFATPTVVKELEHLKYSTKECPEKNYEVRAALREIANGHVVYNSRWFSEKKINRLMQKYRLPDNNDSRIICEVLICGNKERMPVRFVTYDLAQYLIALEVFSKKNSKVIPIYRNNNTSDKVEYRGWKELTVPFSGVTKEVVDESYELVENEYCYWNPEQANELCDKMYVNRKQGLEQIKYSPVHSRFMGEIAPRNIHQCFMFDLLQRRDIPVKLVVGQFGSGKTMLALAHAIDYVQRGKFDKMVYIRNNVQVKDTKDIGALPNGMVDKIKPYLMPIADHVGGEEGLDTLIYDGIVEALPLGFLRGRDYKRTIIFVDECENLTKQHVQLILGRCGEGTEVWFLGDIKQTDSLVFEKNSGTVSLIDHLAGNPLFGMVKLMKSERSAVASLADYLDKNN